MSHNKKYGKNIDGDVISENNDIKFSFLLLAILEVCKKATFFWYLQFFNRLITEKPTQVKEDLLKLLVFQVLLILNTKH